MRTFFLFFLLFILGTGTLTAQEKTSGYMGKRFKLSYDLGFFPRVRSPHTNGDQGVMPFNYQHRLGVDFIASTNTSIGFDYDFYSNSAEAKRSMDGYFDDEEYNFSNKGYIYLQVRQFGVHFRLYNDDFLAPLGKYHELGFSLVRYSGDITKNTFKVTKKEDNSSSVSHPSIGGEDELDIEDQRDVLNTSSTYTSILFHYEFGWERGINKFMLFNYGFRLGLGYPGGLVPLLFAGPVETLTGGVSREYSTRSREYIRSHARTRLLYANQFMVKIGLSFMAF